MTYKRIFTLLITACFTIPAAAQANLTNNRTDKPNSLSIQVERTVAQAQMQAFLTATEDRDPALLYRAEELLQQDKNIHGGTAEHDLDYYYNQLLQQSNTTASAQRTAPKTRTAASSYLTEEYDPGLLYHAEELLQMDRNNHSGTPQHSLEYYYQQLLSGTIE